MSKVEYEQHQLSKRYREQSGIKAYRILSVDERKITIRLPKGYNGKTANFELDKKFIPDYHVPGNYVDLIVKYTVYSGIPGGYQLTYIGPTPQDFIPTYGEEIA